MQEFRKKVTNIHKYKFFFLSELVDRDSRGLLTSAGWTTTGLQVHCPGPPHIIFVGLQVHCPVPPHIIFTSL